MIKLLQYRAALLSVLFGLFGSALSQLLVIDELVWYYTALSSLLALVVNLMVSFLLKGRWSRNRRNYTKITCILFFLCLIAAIYTHTRHFMAGTFPYRDYEDKVSYYVKGSEYTFHARKFKASHSYIESDTDLIREGFGSPEEKDKVWTVQSINRTTLRLISSYSLVVIFFVGIISILLEVLMGHYHKHTTSTFEPF